MALGRRDELIGCHSRLEVSKVEKRCTCGYIDSDAISDAAKFLRYFIITVQFFKQRDSSGVQRQKLSAEVFFFSFFIQWSRSPVRIDITTEVHTQRGGNNSANKKSYCGI